MSSIRQFIEIIKGESNFKEGLSEKDVNDIENVGEMFFQTNLRIDNEIRNRDNEMISDLVKTNHDSAKMSKMEILDNKSNKAPVDEEPHYMIQYLT